MATCRRASTSHHLHNHLHPQYRPWFANAVGEAMTLTRHRVEWSAPRLRGFPSTAHWAPRTPTPSQFVWIARRREPLSLRPDVQESRMISASREETDDDGVWGGTCSCCLYFAPCSWHDVITESAIWHQLAKERCLQRAGNFLAFGVFGVFTSLGTFDGRWKWPWNRVPPISESQFWPQ